MDHSKAKREAAEHETAELEKIRKTHALDPIFWEWSVTFGFPGGEDDKGIWTPIPDLGTIRRRLNQCMERLTRRLRTRLIAFGVIVERRFKAPHAHVLITSIKGHFLDEYDPHTAFKGTWPWRRRIKTHNEIPQHKMVGYLFKPWNFNVNSTRENFTDTYYFNKNRLDRHRANLIKEVRA